MAFENTSAVASGIESALKILHRKGKLPGPMPKVVAMGGDGATSDIGLQALSGALERGHNFTYCLLGQRSLHEHRHPALQLHALRRHDHHLARRESKHRPEHLEEEHAGHCRGPRHPLCGHRLPQLSF